MLEHVPQWLGELLRNRRAGHDKLVVADRSIQIPPDLLDLMSPAFSHGGRLPTRFTADGPGISPPLVWSDVPDGTASLALIVEDPDAPAAKPLVHAVLWRIPPESRWLAEGSIVPDGAGPEAGDVGRNSFLQEGWLPPDPPTGHGEHDYVFQLFALSEEPDLGPSPGRGAFVEALKDKVLAAGVLIGTYSRGELRKVDAGFAAATSRGLSAA